MNARADSTAPGLLTFDIGGEPGAALSTDPPSAWVAIPGRTVQSLTSRGLQRTTLAAFSGVVPAVPATCQTLTLSLYTNVDEIYMAAYGWSGAHATVTQSSSTTHTLGLALKTGTGGWGANGNTAFSESQGSSASQSGVADAYVHNAVNYREYETVCTGQLIRYTLKPVSTYDYLSKFTFASHVAYTASCATKLNGATVVKNTATDLTFGAGVSLPVGLGVSAQSGWSTASQASWTVTSTTKLCGNNATGWPNSSNISLSAG